ncbi:hypothetical protein CONSTELLA_212 [Mycobacterium phage Constella]|uniref:Uncharacterized protein n=1 Tax=Mycobacterium phage Baka TaxID=2902882 RepID=G1D0I4_9CAUD|nr:hypothetical protein N857_gp203 [Mycobacterium phage Wanda]YP_009636397.1 hypothetical protein FGG20_gp206 [Mycobacterium phage Baka]ASZ74293.1 hypothetical protein SEA_SQUINT_218 [Mycobacterium phage Squint]ATN89933.1 hypothetical protein SEA_KLEIN_227 [Mycobacterium phage Klein]AXF51701.1 hypothetical protein CONSTELLA_212 [Mycobacterium phage Constella]QBI98831.1 hypothetical protein SEA_BOBBY_201 [Mycobacterium phage Bobby]QDP43962.1 hypothetical protein SEA_DALLAS_220 [Mycobacterium p
MSKLGIASLGIASVIIGGAIGLSPQANAAVSSWNYTVRWGGATPTLPVILHGPYGQTFHTVTNGDYYALDGYGFTGDIVGVDPVITGPISWASCTLYVDGVAVATDYATKGDGHDVACLALV